MVFLMTIKRVCRNFWQRDGDVDISYHLLGSTGPEHEKVFTSEVSVDGRVIGEGRAELKKILSNMRTAGTCSITCTAKKNNCYKLNVLDLFLQV